MSDSSVPRTTNIIDTQVSEFYGQLWPDPYAWAYWWFANAYQKTLEDGTVKHYGYTQWFPVHHPAPIPARFAHLDAYHGLHTLSAIPKRTYSKTGKPVPPERMRAAGSDITGMSCLYADFDCGPGKPYTDKDAALAHLDTAAVYPSATIDSGGGIHAYWMFSYPISVDDANREDMRKLQAAWVPFVGADNGAHDLQRILRRVATQNHKYDPPRSVHILEYRSMRCYDLEHLQALAGDYIATIEAQERLQAEIDATRTDTPATGAASDLTEWFTRNAKDGERHRSALWMIHKLYDEGIARDVAHELLASAARQISWVPDVNELGNIVRSVYGGAK